MSALELTHATMADLGILLELEEECFPAQPWTRDALEGCFSDGRYLVLLLRSGADTVGYLIGWHVLDEAELARIGVPPALRGRGHGRVLLESGLEEWRRRGVHQVFLDVRAGNASAISLYEKTGFTRVGLRRGYYGDEDAVLMALEISPG